MKVLFLGTPDFSAVVLRALAARYEVTAVVTNPDRPAGRGHKTRPSAASVAADELGIPVFKFASVSREGLGDIRSLGADIAVTAAFGQILSEEFISAFPNSMSTPRCCRALEALRPCNGRYSAATRSRASR